MCMRSPTSEFDRDLVLWIVSKVLNEHPFINLLFVQKLIESIAIGVHVVDWGLRLREQ